MQARRRRTVDPSTPARRPGLDVEARNVPHGDPRLPAPAPRRAARSDVAGLFRLCRALAALVGAVVKAALDWLLEVDEDMLHEAAAALAAEAAKGAGDE